MKKNEKKVINKKGKSRRSFLELALTGTAAVSALSLGLTKDLYAAPSGPIVIGHQCELTGGF